MGNEKHISIVLPRSHSGWYFLSRIVRELWESLKDNYTRKQRTGAQEMLHNCFFLNFSPTQSNSENSYCLPSTCQVFGGHCGEVRSLPASHLQRQSKHLFIKQVLGSMRGYISTEVHLPKKEIIFCLHGEEGAPA